MDNDNLMNSLCEHVAANAECLQRLALIVANALPHVDMEVSQLLDEWSKINKEINDELKQLEDK
jgi:hypothetical protein